MPEIGATLREARMRARIDVSEIEEQTKIRARYLRALENEEWGLLPGEAYTKSFLRAYAQVLGLDGRALVEEYKATYEQPSDGQRADVAHQPPSRAPRRPRPDVAVPKLTRGYLVAVLGACVVIVLALVGLLAGSSSKTTANRTDSNARARPHHARPQPAVVGATVAGAGRARSTPSPTALTLSLRSTGRIWVCLVGEGGHQLIPGSILLPEEEKQHTFRGTRFEVNLGNNNVEMLINGRHQAVPSNVEPIGYSITTSGVKLLEPGHLPTCA